MAFGIIGLLNGVWGAANEALSPLSGNPHPAASTSTCDSGRSDAVRVFLDRFGTVYYRRQPMEPASLLARLQEPSHSEKPIVIEYEAFSFQADRQRLLEQLDAALPHRQITLTPADTRNEYRRFVFPANHPSVQREVLSRQNTLDDELFIRHLELFDQFQSYFGTVMNRLTRAGKELAHLQRERQQITTRSSGKPPLFGR